MAKRRGNGEGSISYHKGRKRWEGYVTNGWNAEKGQPNKVFMHAKTRKELQEKITDALGKIQTGVYREPSKLKLADWLTTWLNVYMKPSLRQTTWESYKTQADKHIIPTLGHLRICQLQTSHLQKLYNEKLQGGRADGKEGGLSPRSVRYIHVVIHSSMEQAKKEGMITINPADSVKLPAQKKKEIQYLDEGGIEKFLAEARKSKHFTAYYLTLNAGLRRGELLGLRWKDVNFKDENITISQGLVRTKAGIVFQPPKTRLGNRTINLDSDIIRVLKFHQKRQDAQKKVAGEAWLKELTFLNPKPEINDLVFTNEIGQPYCPRGFTRHFERLLKRANLENSITFHGLRHTYATIGLQDGEEITTIQENLGHFDVAFTYKTYTHVTDKMKKRAAEKIGGKLATLRKKIEAEEERLPQKIQPVTT